MQSPARLRIQNRDVVKAKGHAYMGDDTGAGGAGADAPPKRRRRSSKWKTKVRAQALLRLLFA